MLARAARDNCSIFRTEGKLDRNTVIGEYLDLCMKYENYFSITKFTVQCMMGFVHEGTGNALFHSSSTMRDLWWVPSLIPFNSQRIWYVPNLNSFSALADGVSACHQTACHIISRCAFIYLHFLFGLFALSFHPPNSLSRSDFRKFLTFIKTFITSAFCELLTFLNLQIS